MTKKEIKAIMAAIAGCQRVISMLVVDEKGMMIDCNDKELYDIYYRLNRCWLYLRRMIEEMQE